MREILGTIAYAWAAVLNLFVATLGALFWSAATSNSNRADGARFVFSLYFLMGLITALALVGSWRRWSPSIVVPLRSIAVAWAGVLTLILVVCLALGLTV